MLLALLMSYMYPLGYSGGDALVEGARFGLMASGYIVVALLFVYNDYQVELAGTVSDIVFHVVVSTVMGAAIGKVYGRTTTATS